MRTTSVRSLNWEHRPLRRCSGGLQHAVVLAKGVRGDSSRVGRVIAPMLGQLPRYPKVGGELFAVWFFVNYMGSHEHHLGRAEGHKRAQRASRGVPCSPVAFAEPT